MRNAISIVICSLLLIGSGFQITDAKPQGDGFVVTESYQTDALVPIPQKQNQTAPNGKCCAGCTCNPCYCCVNGTRSADGKQVWDCSSGVCRLVPAKSFGNTPECYTGQLSSDGKFIRVCFQDGTCKWVPVGDAPVNSQGGYSQSSDDYSNCSSCSTGFFGAPKVFGDGPFGGRFRVFKRMFGRCRGC